MALFKCKMCGGNLVAEPDMTVAECEYCGTEQTIPKTNDEIISNLFNRANNLRLKCEFDKAAQIYEKIVQQDDSEAEAHWGIVLCKYGIEYVEDPKTFKRIPTCHRTLFEAVTADVDYQAAIDYSDALQQRIYESEARAIDRIQKDILAVVKNEKPFDVFICYKESDESGKRTVDSALANDIYHQLTQEGMKVFYAAITLEDKLGLEYEPYIFAALNSAKVMLVLGTKPEYFSAVWVKNEWSRFLKLMKTDRSKLLIPCYRDMDAYDLPEEFAHLQAQDMSKIGFINDVVRGIKKIAKKEEPKATVVKETAITAAAANTAPLLKRAFMFLEDRAWDSADEYCEKVLDIDPENALAYLGKLMAELNVSKQEALRDQKEAFDKYNNYLKAIRFADAALKETLEGYIGHINARNEKERLENTYCYARRLMEKAKTAEQIKDAARSFDAISGYKDSAALARECFTQAKAVKKDEVLAEAKSKMAGDDISNYESAIRILGTIPGWKDADESIVFCRKKIQELKAKREAEKLERERKAEADRLEALNRAKRNKKIAVLSATAAVIAIAVTLVLTMVILPSSDYKKAEELLAAGDTAGAAMAFDAAGDWQDAKARSLEIWAQQAKRGTISTSSEFTIALRNDGTVVATGDNGSGQCDVSMWSDIVAVSTGVNHTVGLRSDGTVVATGYNGSGQCNVGSWTDIVAVSAWASHTVGLRSDYTVVATGWNNDGQCNVSGWTDIVAVSAGSMHTVGLRRDGTVVAVGKNDEGQCNVGDWTDIVAISAGGVHTIGLRSDGTVVAAGSKLDGRCNVNDWTDIIAVSTSFYTTVGLRSDGTVVATGDNSSGQCNIGEWADIVAITTANTHTVGLRSDGTVVAVGVYHDPGTGHDDPVDVSSWTDIKLPG